MSTSEVEVLLDTLLVKGLEAFKKFVGPYRAIVTRNDDPEGRGRIQVQCPRVGHDKTLDVWIKPSFMGSGDNRGFFWPPEVSDTVFVFFQNGDPAKPEVYIGGWPGADEVSEDFEYDKNPVATPTTGKQTRAVPERRGLRTRSGHRLTFVDGNGQETVELVWNKPVSSDPASASDESGIRDATFDDGEQSSLKIDSKGTITLRNNAGVSISLNTEDNSVIVEDPSGSSITMQGGTVTVKAETVNVTSNKTFLTDGASFAAVLGERLLQYLAGHKHLTPTGMSGPPVDLPPRDILSSRVKL